MHVALANLFSEIIMVRDSSFIIGFPVFVFKPSAHFYCFYCSYCMSVCHVLCVRFYNNNNNNNNNRCEHCGCNGTATMWCPKFPKSEPSSVTLWYLTMTPSETLWYFV